MDFGCWTSLLRFLLLLRAIKAAFIPNGVYRTECLDRYLMIAVDLSFSGQEPYFEAVDRTGVFPITEPHAAQCGYTVSILTGPGIVELRASYFSCYTKNKNDQIFTFNLNLIATHADEKVFFALNKTCSLSLPWSPREVTCEVNYLEVSVKSDVLCPLGPKPDGWDSSLQMAYRSATPSWQLILVKPGMELKPMNLSEADLKGYAFAVTENRLVFRAAYGQPHSSRILIDSLPVEVIHAILFSRQEWHVLLVDLIASCTVYEAPYDDSGYMTWKTPLTLYPDLHTTNFSFGLNGELLERSVAQEMGYSAANENATVEVGIPYDADGAYRRSVVTEDLFDVYTSHLYVEQMATSKEGAETRTRTFRNLSSPLLKRLLITENRTIPQEEMFTFYVSNVPGDLKLISIQLNEKEFKAPFVNSSSYTLEITAFPNSTYSYTLTIPFTDPLVIKRFSPENAATENELNIVLNVMIGENSGPYSYHTTVTALMAVSPPKFDAICSEKGITFKMDHEPSAFLWDITVGSDPLTPELAAQQGYLISNTSQTLELHVPLFSHGYKYERITLDGFLATFETYIRNRKTSEVQSSSVKTCPFTAKEIVVCSKDGRMTVVADLSEAVVSGGSPVESSLLDEYCAPIDTDDTRALFSFPLNSCDTGVELDKLSVTYKNKIFYRINSTGQIGSIPVQCTYPLLALHPLFSQFRFESKTFGVGHIVHSLPSVFPTDMQSSLPIPTTKLTMKPTTRLTTRPTKKLTTKVSTATERTRKTFWPPVQYIYILSHNKDIQRKSQYLNTL